MTPPDLEAWAEALGYRFTRPALLHEALTHPSALQNRKSVAHYERLEFLGDRVLGLVVAEMLFNAFPAEREGELARRHAALVKRESLARVGLAIGLSERVVVAKCEESGRGNPALLADCCEALIGALYADGGLAPPAAFVRRHWAPMMGENATPPKDAKTALQEWAQGRGQPLPRYEVVGVEGPPHDPIFLVSVQVAGQEPTMGRGASKRVAEQAAATLLLEKVTE